MWIKSFLGKLFGKEKSGVAENQQSRMDKNDDRNGTKLVCVDCKSVFLFESGEQKFFKIRGLTPPKRCPSCRTKRKHKK